MAAALEWVPQTVISEGASRAEQLLSAAGFGIDEVTVSGHRFTADSDIFDALDLPNVRTMVALDSARVQVRLERLPWVATAALRRNYPGRIDVAIIERLPFAIWLNGETATLIDKSGRELSAIRASDWPALPRIAGTGAPEAATALFDVLSSVPELRPSLLVATRVTQRRWRLELNNGVRLELPPEGEATALAELLHDARSRQLLETANTTLDLRSRTRIAVSPAGGLSR